LASEKSITLDRCLGHLDVELAQQRVG